MSTAQGFRFSGTHLGSALPGAGTLGGIELDMLRPGRTADFRVLTGIAVICRRVHPGLGRLGALPPLTGRLFLPGRTSALLGLSSCFGSRLLFPGLCFRCCRALPALLLCRSALRGSFPVLLFCIHSRVPPEGD